MRSLAHIILGVEGHVGAPKWGLGKLTRNSIILTNYTNQIASRLVHRWNTFGARTSHGQTKSHKIQHGPNLREAITFTFIIYYVPCHGTNTQMSFCLGTPKLESQNSQNWDSCDFGDPYLCVHN
jgi:hypothetical protein